jgi:hypothetical protein
VSTLLVVGGAEPPDGALPRLAEGIDLSLLVFDGDHHRVERWLGWTRQLGAGSVTLVEPGAAFQDSCGDTRAHYSQFVARWPERPLRGGQTFKEMFVAGPVSLWWLTELAQKNRENSPTFDRVCQLDFLRSLLAGRRFDRLWLAVGDRGFADVLERAARRHGVDACRLAGVPTRAGSTSALLVRRFGRMGVWIARCLAARLVVRLAGGPAPAAPAGSTAFLSSYPTLWRRSPSGQVEDCFVDLPSDLAARTGRPSIFGCLATAPGLVGYLRLLAGWAGSLPRHQPPRMDLLDRFLRPGDVLRAYGRLGDLVRLLWLDRFDRAFAASFDYRGVDIYPLVRRDLVDSLVTGVPHFLLLATMVRHFVREHRPARAVVRTEMYGHGRAATVGVRAAGQATEVVGLAESPIVDMRLYYSYVPGEIDAHAYPHRDLIRRPPVPDHFAVYGPGSAAILARSGFPLDRVHVVGPVRYQRLARFLAEAPGLDRQAMRARLGLSVAPGQRLVLVATSIMPDETVDLVRACRLALEGRTDCRLVFKPHPRVGDVVAAELARRPGPLDPGQTPLVSRADVHELIFCADVVIVTWSTTGAEAVALGRPTIHLRLGFRPDQSPFAAAPDPAFPAWGPADLVRAIDAIVAGSPEVERRLAAGPAAVAEWFSALDSRPGERFFRAVVGRT